MWKKKKSYILKVYMEFWTFTVPNNNFCSLCATSWLKQYLAFWEKRTQNH